MANDETKSAPGSPIAIPVNDESKWTDEGGSNQHFRQTDEPQWPVFNGNEDRTWHRYDLTYGPNFEDTVRPHESDNQPHEAEGKK